MLRRVLYLVDALLIVAGVMLGVHVHRVWTVAPATAPAGVAAGPVPDASPPALAPAPTRPALATFAVVAERNLFSPNRTEAVPEPPRPGSPTATPAAPTPPKPRLYGIVLLPDGKARAYLEDVQRRKVFAYAVGDSVADSRLERILSDRVVLRRGSEVFEVLLHDPAKPKPPAAMQPGAGSPGGPPSRIVPGGPPSSGAGAPALPGAPALGGPRPRPPTRAPLPPAEGSRPGVPVPEPGTAPEEDEPS